MAAAYTVEKAGSKELVPTTSLEDEKLGNHSIDDSQHFIPGSEGVTQHDLDTLRHVADRLPAAAWLVAIVEFAERYVVPPSSRFMNNECRYYRWTYYGTTNIFNNYIRAPLPKFSTTGAVVIAADRANGIAGALGKGQQISFAIRTVRIDWASFS